MIMLYFENRCHGFSTASSLTGLFTVSFSLDFRIGCTIDTCVCRSDQDDQNDI